MAISRLRSTWHRGGRRSPRRTRTAGGRSTVATSGRREKKVDRGDLLGLVVGDCEGLVDGLSLGDADGLALGLALGLVVGDALGDREGLPVGPAVATLGLVVGSAVLEQPRVTKKAKLGSPTGLAGRPYAPSSSPLPSDATTATVRVTLSLALVAVAQRKVKENACDAPPASSPDAGSGPAMSQSLSAGETVAVNSSGAAPWFSSSTGATVRSAGYVTE